MGCFWSHDWQKWGEVFDVTVMRRFYGDIDFRESCENRQRRECNQCGKIQERIV